MNIPDPNYLQRHKPGCASDAAKLHEVVEAILDAEQGCVDPTSEYVSWRSLAHLARIVLEAPTGNAPVDEQSSLIARCEELQDALHRCREDYHAKVIALQKIVSENAHALSKIAAPKRPDGTYNLSREACEQIAKEALRRADT